MEVPLHARFRDILTFFAGALVASTSLLLFGSGFVPREVDVVSTSEAAVASGVTAISKDNVAPIQFPFPAARIEPHNREHFLQLEKSGAFDLGPHPKSYVTACVLAKDALDVLPEFVVRNRMAGVDHFVIIDDSAPDDFELLHRALRPLSAFVTLLRSARDVKPSESRTGWSVAPQLTANFECAQSIAAWSEWVAFIDVDEFFEPSHPANFGVMHDPQKKFLHEYLREREDTVPAVCFLWRMVLTNGIFESMPCGETFGSYFTMACNSTRYLGSQQSPLARSKTVARIKYLDYRGTPHEDGYAHIGYAFQAPFQDYHCNSTGTENDIVLVHYWSGSLFDYFRKVARGRPRRPQEKRPVFELLLREFLCFPQFFDLSSALRSAFVKAHLNHFGYVCDPAVTMTPPHEQIIQSVRDSAALSYFVAQTLQGKKFNLSEYNLDTNLSFKIANAGYLSHLDSIPWVHYYMYGHTENNSTAHSRWFSNIRER